VPSAQAAAPVLAAPFAVRPDVAHLGNDRPVGFADGHNSGTALELALYHLGGNRQAYRW